MFGRRQIPWAMIWLRVFLGPLLLFGSQRSWDGSWLAGIVLLALLDDIFDGMLARRWQCDTENLRRADSIADTWFYLCVASILWIRDAHLLRANWKILAVLAAMELLRHGLDRIKFKKSASYHSYLAKTWGLVMGLAVIQVLRAGGPGWLIAASAIAGIVADAEGFAMSLILPRWRHDVKSIPAAWKVRQRMLDAARPASMTR